MAVQKYPYKLFPLNEIAIFTCLEIVGHIDLILSTEEETLSNFRFLRKHPINMKMIENF